VHSSAHPGGEIRSHLVFAGPPMPTDEPPRPTDGPPMPSDAPPTPTPMPPEPSPTPMPTDNPLKCPLPVCMRFPSYLDEPSGLQAILDELEPALFPECFGATEQPGFPDCPDDEYYSDALIMYLVDQGLADEPPCTRSVYRTYARGSDSFAELSGIMATRNNQVCIECITVSGIESPFTAMHLHAPAQVGNNAPPVLTLTSVVQNQGKGVYTVEQSCFGMSDAIGDAIDSELSYINFHTAAFPNGEVRGHMFNIDTDIVTMYSWVGGASARGPKGRVQIHIVDFSVVCFEDMFFWNSESSPLGVSLNGPGGFDSFLGAPGLIFLDEEINSYDSGAVFGTPWHCVSAVEETVGPILAEDTYMNFTFDSPPDAFIGPVTIVGRVLREENVRMPTSKEIVATFTAAPGVSTPATGTATIRVYEYAICMEDLTIFGVLSSFTNLHLHGPAAPGGSGGVLVPLATPVFSSIGGTYRATFWCTGITEAIYDDIMRNETYLNVHSSAHPGGEIRSHLFFGDSAESMRKSKEMALKMMSIPQRKKISKLNPDAKHLSAVKSKRTPRSA